jgi:diacylglycerol O-acyltransferase / wax synthase
VGQRLPGVDAGFLYMETPTQHMHTLKIALVDASSTRGGYSFEVLERELAARLHLLPPFRRRLLHDPLRLHHPLWVDDEGLDLKRQVRRARVPAPGGKEEFEQLVGEIAGTPLDRTRPLWEMWICEGLADGRVGVVTKMHHTIADGVAANALLANVVDASAPAPTPSVPERLPSGPRLVLDSVLARLLLIVRLPALLARTARGLRDLVRYRRTTTVHPPRPVLDTSNAFFNGALTPRRSFSTATLSLEDAKRVKAAHGVTLNDVVLAVVGGALRSWLDDQGRLPDRPLTAGVPVATDPKGAPPRLGGNQVSNLFTSLATDVVDPVERLKAISTVTREAKQVQSILGLDLLERWVEHTPPLPFALFMRTYSRLRVADHHPAPFNVVVSNVPGPSRALRIGGARLTDVFSVGPILEGIALNVTVWSYEDRLAFSVLACPDTLPDLPSMTAHLAPALAELVKTADFAADTDHREGLG